MRLQEFIHSLEQGGLARWIKFLVVFVGMAFFYVWFVFLHFRGLTEANGMDQAQVAREIARGNGFSTKDFRPLEIAMFEQNIGAGKFPIDKTPDIYHAPLNPYINAPFLLLTKKSWPMTMQNTVYGSDRMIATVSAVFMLLGFLMSFLTARKIFDEKIAGMSIVLAALSSQYWSFIQTGLPQMLMFFLFSCCAYVLYRAIEARLAEKPTTALLAIAGFLFGLLALAHNLTIWIFLGALIFSALYFKPRYRDGAIMLLVFLLVFSPWLVRNFRVCGNPFGMSHLSLIGSLNGSEINRMRGQDPTLDGLSLGDLRKHQQNAYVELMGKLVSIVGGNIVAPVFFVTLLYVFKRREASDFRWLLFIMWLFALEGVSIVGLNKSNDLFILFVPLITLYGFAYVMMLWTRLDINIPLFRYTFLGIIYHFTAIPLAVACFEAEKWPIVNWPPYVPPFISLLRSWTKENEAIASDMPWAVAWYADRKSLLIPVSISDFLNLYDWSELNGSLVGLYLTPITGDKPLLSDILKGDDKDWAPFVVRSVRSRDFPFHYSTALPIDNECIFYCESDRWSPEAD